MAPHRSDLEAAHGRIAALERELAALRAAGQPRDRFRVPLPPLPAPPQVVVHDTPERLRIEWRASRDTWPAAARAWVAVSLPVALWLAVRDDSPFIVSCFAIAAFAVTMAMALGERIAVEVTGDRLTLRGGEFVARDRQRLARAEIEQLYCVLRHEANRATYELWAELVTGDRLCLVRGIATRQGARYLERTLEHRLGIVDRPVAGELAAA